YPVPPFTAPARAAVTLPGSKSITNRALILGALAVGETVLENALFSEDTLLMIAALQVLGFEVDPDAAAGTIRIEGLGGEIPIAEAELYVGNSGTSARFLSAFCALHPLGHYRLKGSAAMHRRPMRGLIRSLEQLGARIRSNDDHLPLEIESKGLTGGAVDIDATESSQFLSALLMVAPYCEGHLEIRLQDPSIRPGYVEMTLRMMRQFGFETIVHEPGSSSFRIDKPSPYSFPEANYRIEPDASAASYFLALPAVTGGEVLLRDLRPDSLQADAAFAAVLKKSGLRITETEEGTVSRLDPKRQPPKGLTEDFFFISDTFMTLAACAPLLRGKSRITGISHTRHQECDRIAATTEGLRLLGQKVEDEPGAITIHPAPLQPASIPTHEDHRIAMSFGILGCHDLHRDGRPWLSVENPACSAKTYPDFFSVLETLRRESGAT
ncbi:MAG: 3-phosphoshikimate 1-carboxyvinyltransferase, partial [Puniceicoccaceae bacterium]